MAADEDLVFTLAWDDIDAKALPEDSRQRGTDAFRRAVVHFLQRQYESLSGKATIIVNDSARTVTVRWARKQEGLQSVEETVQSALERGDFGVAVPLLKALLATTPGNPTALYNLGMVYSDQGKLALAEDLLSQAAAADPENARIVVALGVAQARGGDLPTAIKTLERAAKIAPEDAFAHQNLGACLLKEGDAERAENHFRRSLLADPANLRSQFGLAQALETSGRLHDADEVYQAVIKAAGHTPVGEMAKEGRTRIAHALMRQRGGDERPDVVMYCLGALERFDGMTSEEIRKLGQEIAVLGMKGLDINDPATKYRLRSLPGEFSGLHLVSLMYVAFQHIAPGTDVGIDLATEYQTAKKMHRGQRG